MTPEVQSILQSIQFHLQSTSTCTRAPAGFDCALVDVCEFIESPERRLLEHSVFAWVALVSNKSVHRDFNELSPEDEQTIFKSIQKLSPNAATIERIRQIFARKQRKGGSL